MILNLLTQIQIMIGVNMKVLFKHMINGYTGKADDSVIYYNRYLNRVIIRRRPNRKNGEENRKFGSINKNLRLLGLSENYKNDFKIYTTLYSRLRINRDQSVFNWYFLFLKMMFALAQLYHSCLRNRDFSPELRDMNDEHSDGSKYIMHPIAAI
ncbi:MAG: hypothetical protein PHI68_06445 [Candidatus Cloacimonetes bacterium]|nr:hypothetical protein [Candidatus Cloacimonadota bacterium]